jgi:hypothetical protein
VTSVAAYALTLLLIGLWLKLPFHFFLGSSFIRANELTTQKRFNLKVDTKTMAVHFSYRTAALCLAFLQLALIRVDAFAVTKLSTRSHELHMVPKFDKATEKWIPSGPEEMPGAGYDKLKTLLLHGPSPYFQRVFQPDNYEQAVLKYMASDGVDYITAQGNMDAYLNNPADWAFNKIQAKKTGKEPDYTTLNQAQLVKTLTWAAIVFALGGRAIYSLATGTPFNLHD